MMHQREDRSFEPRTNKERWFQCKRKMSWYSLPHLTSPACKNQYLSKALKKMGNEASTSTTLSYKTKTESYDWLLFFFLVLKNQNKLPRKQIKNSCTPIWMWHESKYHWSPSSGDTFAHVMSEQETILKSTLAIVGVKWDKKKTQP